jgi:hypothetical protein
MPPALHHVKNPQLVTGVELSEGTMDRRNGSLRTG